MLSPDENQSHSPDRELILLFNQAYSQAALPYVLRMSVILANFLLLLYGGMDAHVGDTPPGSFWEPLGMMGKHCGAAGD